MRSKPPGVDEAELRRVIAQDWLFEAATLSYLAVGAGSHHWVASDPRGERRFVTVDDLGTKPWLGADTATVLSGLKNAYEIAGILHDQGLDFVLAPLPTLRGDVVVRLDGAFTIALFPFLDGAIGGFDDVSEGKERQAALRMWAELHASTPVVRRRAQERGFNVPGRIELEAAMSETDRHWAGGPYSLEARHWLSSNTDWLIHALATFDAIAEKVARARGELVITHGEPHGANIIVSEGRRYLIDWDTVALALPERDLWMLDNGTSDSFRPYVEASGRSVDGDALKLYGIVWHLTDVALFVRLLRGRHADDADSRQALMNLNVAAARLAAYIPR